MLLSQIKMSMFSKVTAFRITPLTRFSFLTREKIKAVDNIYALENSFDEIFKNSEKLIESTKFMKNNCGDDPEMREYINENSYALDKNLTVLFFIQERYLDLNFTMNQKEVSKKLETLQNNIFQLKNSIKC